MRHSAEDQAAPVSSFQRLLAHLDSHPRRSAEKYLALRGRLCAFFARRGIGDPDSYADDTLNRVMLRSEKLEAVGCVEAWAFGIARLVVLEAHRKQRYPSPPSPDDPFEAPVLEIRHRCLELCLNCLPEQDRALIVEYYREPRGRLKLAARHAVSPRVIRGRVFRIRKALRCCIQRLAQMS